MCVSMGGREEGRGGGSSLFTLGCTLGMLTGYNANPVRSRSHAETGQTGGCLAGEENASWGLLGVKV